MSEKNVVRPEKNPFEGIDVQKVYDVIAEIFGAKYNAKITIKVKRKDESVADAS